jgi:hypothetical protein
VKFEQWVTDLKKKLLSTEMDFWKTFEKIIKKFKSRKESDKSGSNKSGQNVTGHSKMLWAYKEHGR